MLRYNGPATEQRDQRVSRRRRNVNQTSLPGSLAPSLPHLPRPSNDPGSRAPGPRGGGLHHDPGHFSRVSAKYRGANLLAPF